jgi:hypothetical protein
MNLFALLLGAAAIAYGVAKYFRLPSVPVLIATGMSLSLAGWVPSELSIGNGIDEYAGARSGVFGVFLGR